MDLKINHTKKLLLSFFIISLVFTFSTCKNTTTNDNTSVLVKNENKVEESPLDTMFSLVKFIKLETIEQSLIKDISKIRKVNGKYFISSNYQELLVFLEDGSFSHKINKIGNGPGEYSMLADFDVLSNNNILVLDAKKIVVYDENGDCIKNIPLSIVGFNVKAVSEEEILVCASGEEYVIYLLDYSGNILSQWLKNKKSTSIGSNVPFISLNHNQVIFQIGFSNDFISYDIKGKKMTEISLLNNSDCLSSEREDALLEQYGFAYLDEFPSLKMAFGIASCKDYLLFKLGNDAGHRVYLVDTKNDFKLKYKSVLINDENSDKNKLNIDYAHFGIADSCFITYVPYSSFDLIQKNYDIEISSEDENPVLMEFIVNGVR